MASLQPRFLLPLTSEAPDDDAVICGDRRQSWAELEDRAIRIANGLIADGLTDGARWGLLCHNRIEWAELVVGNVRSGARYVPLNWHLTASELAELLVDSDSQMLLTDPESESIGREAAERAGISDVRVLGPEYEAWIESQSAEPPPSRQMGSPLMYTGGTTGRSKGVVRSDSKAPVEQWVTRFGQWGQLAGAPDSGVMLISTPLYHALGAGGFNAGLARRHPVVIMPRFDPVETLRLIERHGVTSGPMVPTQFIRLLKLDEQERNAHDLSSLQWILHTAAPCPPWAKRAMIEWLGPVVTELYGSSEGTGPVICSSEEWLERPGTVGRPQGALEITIVDDNGADLPPGEIGTIYAKRPDGAPEYHDAPDKTADSRLPDGRFTVGDVGWLDDEGFLFLADRRVDLILRGGSNIYPAEIEGVLSEHPDVGDVAVFGIPDPDMGEAIKAVVEPADGSTVDVDSVLTFARERLASFKIPQSVDVVDALPREAHGKLKKRLLRDPYWPD